MRDKKKGFTLVEAVICIAIIGILSMGYLTLSSASANIFHRGVEYDRQSTALLTAAQNGTTEEGMTEETEEAVQQLQFSGSDSISLDRVTLSMEDGSGAVSYYRYHAEE